MKTLLFVSLCMISSFALAEPPMPLEASVEEIHAVLKAMPSHMDSVVNISTQLDDVYKVQVLRRGQLCTLEFNVKRVGIPGSPSDTYTVEASLIRISGNLPICT